MQRLLRISANDTQYLDKYLDDGWIIKDFKPLASRIDKPGYYSTYAYVLIEKN